MKIEAVDFFYLAMPEILDIADGSQDALVVRVSAGGHVGWGECEASPLTSIAAFVAPMSHGACQPVSASVLGQTLDGPDDIRRMSAAVASRGRFTVFETARSVCSWKAACICTCHAGAMSCAVANHARTSAGTSARSETSRLPAPRPERASRRGC